VTQRATSLSETLLPNSNVGYDVMVFVGLSRFLGARQREEIRAALLDQGVLVSTGEVSRLSRLFVRYLSRLHRTRIPQLKALLDQDGGWPLHVDSTGEAGRGTTLVVIAGWRRWVLCSRKIATERADLVLPCLRQTVRRFGPPCAALRDLGKAMTNALDELVSELGLDIPVLACHQHFLADVGKDLLEPAHAELRALFRRFKIRPNLRELVRELGRTIGTDIDGARSGVVQWQSSLDNGVQHIETGATGLAVVRALAQWTLDVMSRTKGLDFPFERPYLDLNDRAMTTLRAVDAFLRSAPPKSSVAKALRRLHRHLEPVDSEVPFAQVAKRLRHRAALFDKLRGVLRLAGPNSDHSEETEKDLDRMHTRLDELVESLKADRPQRGPAQDTREAIDLILKHLEKHGENLWGHVISLPESAGGGARLVSRTNFVAEGFFGELKHDERLRSGHKNLGVELEHLPDEAALVRNLREDDYVAAVCGSLDNLAHAFAELDRHDRENVLNDVSVLEADDEEELESILQLASASVSSADRRVIRSEAMDQRIVAAAKSRATRLRC
jgi:hypothetical protein